ncbi:RIP metalloprotease RseP [Elizabethkingia anophelis]|uniref:RIP metalloprotease RseP n=1 Tax=Elizabethkingia anophelis TaxID=1117645 RepID=UPI0012B1BB1D|nr:RIP metalloprotease RseP [Elizabethkingia anophelis]MCT4021792.1 RIP metalloprotease RseP [Elizabethkingia anophelis]MCT4055282.1 RIP metalloprotease RseP [Elizabethkingia anophelis]MCT4087235.1 RIP metalloprotease RseP [Elizabethkingia anophelis]MCT4104826.1 RIP metalloprotease RseP [Elizabethkingia anophelis]MCT4230032.1 RIP metalloprotease RseP [Elizabethkingia anophelis]
MELFNQIFQFVLSISILVILHELGHFIPAKLFKTKVEKFYLFFDPWFSLVKKKVGETEYGIGWLPFGGYVKIAGMVDESMDTEQLKKPAEPWEFRSKPAWQRLIIMLGGVTVNFFLAWLIYSCLSFFNGETYHDNAKFENGIAVSEEGRKMGLETGDKILKIDGKPAERMETSMINMLFANEATVLRNGKEVTFPVNENGVAEVIKSNEAKAYFSPRFPAVIDSIAPNMGAQKAGLLKGDKIISVNGKPALFFDEVSGEVMANKNKTITIGVERKGEKLEFPVNVDAKGKIGFTPDFKIMMASFEKTSVTKEYGFLQAIPRGFTRTIDVLVMQIKQFKIIFNQKTKGYTKVSGPIGIIKQMPAQIDWVAFWSFTAMFSVWLAFLNLIPIPGLDGGHVLFTLWEMVTGKPVPQKVLENAQMIGVIFLLGLMILIFGSDIYKLIFNR